MLKAVLLLLLAIVIANVDVEVYAAPSQSGLSGRVVNGTDAAIEQFPYVMSLRSSSGSHSCGCSLIAPQIAMTAAHCTAGKKPSQLSVQYGQTKISSSGPNVVKVTKIIQHEDYNPNLRYANDISLLLLEKEIPIDNKSVGLVKLPKFEYVTPQLEEGAPGILVGWGLNGTGGVVQQTLQQVGLKVYSDAECVARHGGATDPKYHICGGVDEGWKGQCSGDSGGPLLIDGVQVGIVSWSIKPCTTPPYPGVYCKVANYIDWIMRNQLIVA